MIPQVFKELEKTVDILYIQLNLKSFKKATGRPRVLDDKKVLTLALYKRTQGIPTKKQIWKDFLKNDCSYKTFNESVNRLLPLFIIILKALLSFNRNNAHIIKYTDSTDIPVCKNKNSKHHKTMSFCATWGRSSKGFYYGIKLHVTTDFDGKLLAIYFTPANVDDRKAFMKLNEKMMGLFIADAGYISQELSQKFHIENHRLLIAKPKANMKKVATIPQRILYRTRSRVETVFNNTKKFRNLISSLPRSVDGYIGNYICSLLAEILS